MSERVLPTSRMNVVPFVLVIASKLLAPVYVSAAESAVNESKIIGGERVDIEDAVWIVQVWASQGPTKNAKLCGGSLISKFHVLTAAHCVENYRKTFAKALLVTYGHAEQTVSQNKRFIAKLHFHPKYKSSKSPSSRFGYVPEYDAAVLLLTAPIVEDVLALPPESSTGVAAGKRLRISGWGRTNVNSRTSTYLLSSVFTVLTPSVCSKRVAPVPFGDYEFCIDETVQHAQCRGDSGSPAYDSITEIQYGIVSWGDCGSNGAGVLVDLSRKVIRDFLKPFVAA